MTTVVALSSFAAGAAAPRVRAAVGLQHGAGASFGARSPPVAGKTAQRRHGLVVRAQNDPKPTTKASTKFWDVLSFNGPAPERINGRLAMLGFVAALSVEASRGVGLLSQAESGAGLAWFAATTAVFSVASLVPLLKGESPEERAGPIMNANAELWNGRLAMLGIVALAATEYLTGAPFVDV
ncbi:low molecular mass early light-inducible protein HV90, chloroplastic [Lolium perenne]|uniref:low molecular mass early light-inducible protein HV90, chloroplastic n=1 Tax=Lolium perenne TaxID=4522 RepID=UPI0021EACE83|nr:low molecular mass early light-inducible protein HV90, chloroplastic-like [Lolium perenne]